MISRYYCLDFPLEILSGLPIRNKNQKSCRKFVIFISILLQSYCRDKVEGQNYKISYLPYRCLPAFQKLFFCHDTEKMATLKLEKNC